MIKEYTVKRIDQDWCAVLITEEYEGMTFKLRVNKDKELFCDLSEHGGQCAVDTFKRFLADSREEILAIIDDLTSMER